jgi:hypothetical protein
MQHGIPVQKIVKKFEFTCSMNVFTCVHEVLVDGCINGKVVERRVVGGTLQKTCENNGTVHV